MITRRLLGARKCFIAFSTVLALACSADRIISVPPNSASQTIAAAVGEEIHITFGNVGPAQYESPPQISSPELMFLGVEDVPPNNPGGPTQRFRFKAVRAGQAIIHFRRVLQEEVVSAVDDTVQIR